MNLQPDYHTIARVQRQHRLTAADRRLARALRLGNRKRPVATTGRGDNRRRPGFQPGPLRPALAE